MKLDAAIEKVVVGKPFGMTMVKGARGTGKTSAAAFRALYLKSSYCLYEGEKVLVTTTDGRNLDRLKKCYKEAGEQYEHDYTTLFSLNKMEPVEFYSIEELVDKYYDIYARENKLNPVLIEAEDKIHMIKECIDELKEKYGRVKLIRNCNEKFIIDEIDWIKSCDITSMEEYKASARLGRVCDEKSGTVRLIRNSKSREVLFHLMELYNEKLLLRNMIDNIDKERMALKAVQEKESELYTHMVVDDAHKLTRVQLYLLMALKSRKAYSSFMLTVNHKADTSNGGWIIKGRRQKDLGFDTAIRNSYLKKSFLAEPEMKSAVNEAAKAGKIEREPMEKFVYVDMRHKLSFEFSRDTSNFDELILNQGEKDVLCGREELAPVPVFSNIAAGEPITINPDMVNTFSIPHYWIKGMKDCFMLKVKGDSMIGAGIDDGDFVVIRMQSTASNRDIVAVDIEGSATLKRLWIGKEEVLLMPENEKYSPIEIKDRDAVILGIVVGIIKPAA